MSGVLVFLFCILFIVFSAAAFLLYQRNSQVNELINIQIPQIEFTNKYNQLLRDNNNLTLSLPQSKTATELNEVFKKIEVNLTKISELYSHKFQQLNKLNAEIKNVGETVARINGNDDLNVTLKLTAIDQIDTLSKILVKEIADKTKEQDSLSRLVAASGAYVYSGQANAYIDSIKAITQLSKIQSLLDEALVNFNKIDLSASVVHLDEVTSQIDLAMETWLSTLTNISTDLDIQTKIETLKQLLNTEQRVLGKWHSHIRLAEEVVERIRLVNGALNELNANQQRGNFVSGESAVIPSTIKKITQKIGIELTLAQYNYALIAGLLLSVFLIVVMLIRVQLRLKEYGNNTVKLCESLLLDSDSKAEQGNFVQSAEHLRIVGLIQQVKKPEHSENQYQDLVKLKEQESTFIAGHHRLINWRYSANKRYVTDNKEIIQLCGLDNQRISSWHRLFKKDSISNIIAIAKNVRDSNTTLSCHAITASGERVDLLISFEDKSWFGTIHKNDKVELLQSSLAKTKGRLKTAETKVLEELGTTTEKFSKMVLGAMLQSQGGSIDSNGASIQVYRQLTRVFDWCRQSKIVAQLQHSNKDTPKTNLDLMTELHAILFNAMSEVHLQRNKIFLQSDRQLMPYAQVDHRLFHRMLLGVIRVTLAELFNAKMLLGLKVVDLDNGMQTIRFTLTVIGAKPIKAIPDLVSRLANEDRKVTSSLDIIFYLRTLMYHLNINDVQTSLNDKGFSLFFDAQIVMGREPERTTERPVNMNLKREKILVISGCEFTQKVATECITNIAGEVGILLSADTLKHDYPKEVLEKKAVKLIIVGDDAFKEDIHKVESYIATLPEAIKPKLMVMQPAAGASLNKVGLYGQASAPICQRSFQSDIVELLQSKHNSNRIVEPEIFSQFNYLPTRVEVLLAVSNPERHQTLIRILQWLGLHVHIVSQPQAMTKQWQLGRYLVLISEFNESPFIVMSTGRNVHRGVFTFKDMLFDTPNEIASNSVKNWKISKLPNLLDIKSLTSLLEPWLRTNTSIINTKLSNKAVPKKVNIAASNVKSFDEFLNEAETLNEEDKAYLSHSKILLPDTSELPVDVVFDLSVYARNQGSFELASYMLDEYTQDIESAISLIEEHVVNEHYMDAQKPISNIMKISQVMAAKDLEESCTALNASLKICMSSDKENSKIEASLKSVKSECERLVSFAEAI
jgi:hypothetical protein